MVNWITNLAVAMIAKRKAHHCKKSGFTSLTNSYHMCAILKGGSPISYGTNVYNINDGSTEHAEAQALRKLYEKIGKRLNAKKMAIDIFVVRTNGGNSKPCVRCINTFKHYSQFFSIRYVYYTHPNEPNGIRCVKFSQLSSEEPHICSFDRRLNISRRNSPTHEKRSTKKIRNNISTDTD